MPGHQETVSSSSVKSIISVGRSVSSKGYSNGTNLRRLSLQALPFCQQHSRISSANVFKKSKQAIRLMAALRFLVIGTSLSVDHWKSSNEPVKKKFLCHGVLPVLGSSWKTYDYVNFAPICVVAKQCFFWEPLQL